MNEEHTTDKDAGLWMPEFGATPSSRNGRPLDTHERACDEELHADHRDSVCATCGCCWGCDSDCCAEYICPNHDCGCSVKPSRVFPPDKTKEKG